MKLGSLGSGGPKRDMGVFSALPSSLEHVGGWAFQGTPWEDDENNWQDGLLYMGDVLLEADLQPRCTKLST